VFPLLANEAVHSGFMHKLIAAAFDPQWNLEHQGMIFAIVFCVLFISGVGIPAPEDIPLTIAGFSTFKQCQDQFIFHNFALTFIFVVIPILGGDLVAYHMGKRWGFGLRDRWKFLRSALSDARIAKVRDWFDRYGAFTVFMGRQVAGVRFVTFFTAGTMRVPLRKFVAFDFLGCLVSVPVWLTLGVLASRYGQQWLHFAMRRVGMSFLLGSIAAILVFALTVKLKNRGKIAVSEDRL